MRSEPRRGLTVACALTLGLLFASGATARADWFHHTIEKEVPAMDYRTGSVMMAPPIPHGAYTMDPVGCVHGALGTAAGAAHGLLGKLCALCGQPGCGNCGGLGHGAGGGNCGACGGDGCSHCDGHGKLTTCGMLHGGGLGHGHNHGAGSGYIAPMAVNAGHGHGSGNGLLGGLFGKRGTVAGAGGCATCGTAGLTPSSQYLPTPQAQAAPQSDSACGLCGGKGRLGAGLCGGCGGKGILAGLGHGIGNGGLRGCTSCGGQGFINGNACGPCGGRGLLAGLGHSHGNGGACDSPCNACGGSGHGANGGNCGACGGSGCLKGALQHVSGAVHGAAGTVAQKLFHKGEIEYFVGPGGPVPITPGYVPYVVPVRSPRDFFAFPPMSDRAIP